MVGIIDDSRPHLALHILLDAENAVFVVVGGFAGGGVEIAIFHNHENTVIATELAKRETVVLVVETKHIGVEPHFTVAEG